MSLGPIMLDLEGPELTQEEREILAHPLVGGVILFTRNYESADQLEKLVSDIHEVRTPRLLTAVDHEGGRVQRFRDGFTNLPPAARLGGVYDQDHSRGRNLTKLAGWLMAAELRAFDIDFSFAPVLDIAHGISAVIGDRAFHHDPDCVAELAHAFMQGMTDAGMAATGKHFPGHGAVAADSHTELPVDEREFSQILSTDLLPFRRMIGYGLAAVMPAHVIYPQVDSRPAGFSTRWLREILRRRLQFQGVIFSDDLDMAGASVAGGDYADRAVAAINAGCDMVLVCNNRQGALRVIEGLEDRNDPVSHMRLARMHGRHRLTRNELHRDPRWQEAERKLVPYQQDATLELKL
ncbi:MAG: beta-N-acetylhexosaminidase [Pseudomonadota bacterium]|nr:MAG: beta-N-acetylhexosaminidase [Pseudomonadota bacterium]